MASLPIRIPMTLDRVCTLALDKLGSPSTRTMYSKALRDFIEWWRAQGSPALSKAIVQGHRTFLIAKGYSASSVNQRLTAVRRLAVRASEEGLLPIEHMIAIQHIKGTSKVRPASNLLTVKQAEDLMNAPDSSRMKGQRDRALLALLVACGLRRDEIVRLNVDDLQHQGGRWALVSVIGAHRRNRMVPLPPWARLALDKWLNISLLKEGAMFRAVDRNGTPSMRRLSAPMVAAIVRSYGKQVGLKICPRDLRRTCAALCRSRGADLEQIQLLLGHSTIHATEQLLATPPKLMKAPNGRLGLRWRRAKKLAS